MLFSCIIGAVVLFCATYALEPYRRVLIGFAGGALLTLSLAYLLGLDHLIGGFVGTALVIAGGLVGAIIVPQVFDSIIVAASAFGGATMAMTGAHLLLPGVGLFDRFAGGFPPRLVTIVLTVIGIGWQNSETLRSGFNCSLCSVVFHLLQRATKPDRQYRRRPMHL